MPYSYFACPARAALRRLGQAAVLLLGAWLNDTPAAMAQASPSDSVLVLRGRLWDGTGRPALEQGVLVLRGGRVAAAGPASRVSVPAGARVLTLPPGHTILPGLIDLHQHLRPQYAAWLLPAGVTTVRDANNTLETLAEVQRIRPYAPRVLFSGPLLDGSSSFFHKLLRSSGMPEPEVKAALRPATAGPIGQNVMLEATTPEQARAAVDSLAAHGVAVVKLYEQLAWPVYQAAAARARERGLPVMTDLGMLVTRGLSGAQVDARQALRAGVASIEHASGYALAYQRLGGDLTREPFDDKLLDQLARETVRARTALVPTLSVFYGGAQLDSARVLTGLPGADNVPTEMKMFFAMQQRGLKGDAHQHSLTDLHLTQALLRRVQQRGGLIGAGTDAPAGSYNLPGGGLHRELLLLVEAGLTPAQALYAATGGAARILRRPQLGTLQSGHVADVVVVAGRPDENIRATRAIRYVIQAGRVLPLAQLQQQARSETGSMP
jgi:cytosine/adenosine deaminase-related metal-dependent hydrolase